MAASGASRCLLLRGRLSGGTELAYRGRPARQLRVTRAPGAEARLLGPLMFFPADAIVDAETGCLLRLTSYSGDALAIWWELDDIRTEPVNPDEFRAHVPPGTPTVDETGNPFADAAAVMPGMKGTAARAAAEAVNRTAGAVSAARSFRDDLRGHRQTGARRVDYRGCGCERAPPGRGQDIRARPAAAVDRGPDPGVRRGPADREHGAQVAGH
jgi:hypothetical protein